ncbi:right-handed parallel beta-helix repeat-containing protein [Oleiharenicola sp. Vm1]|uniref:golvesin C-terminal-like domain-containing protein n=1 Tax=Oleiharenicola sp. Vm1 TaxID=3398393 RepID=UPI0039F6170A
MSRPALLALAVLVLGTPLPAATETVFHVAPAPVGDDAHDGSAGAPFASIDRARQAVRARLAAPGPRGDLVVEIGAGTYELAAPLRFTSEDSGRDGQAVVYRAATGATVVLSGGRRITGWTVERPGVASAAVGRDVEFRQLWVDDRRAIRARTPNAGRTLKLASEKQADGFDLPRECLAGVTVRPNEVELSVLIAWMHKRLRIARVTAGGQPDTLRAVIAEPEWDAVTKQPQGDRVYLGRSYWLENAPEFLDAPGEFHLDRSRGVLRYLPRPGEDPVRATVVRPALESLVVLDGRPEAPVRNLRFEGLTFAYTGWTRPDRAGFVDVQANSLVPADPAAAVDARYRHNQRKDRVPAAFQAFTADRIAIRGCRFQHLGGTGVMFTHGGDDNVIEGNSFFDLAAGGIELGEDAARPDSPRLFPRRNRIANNFLTQIGEDYFGSVAILGYYTEASVIAHNEIVAVPYTGISQGWGWGNPPAPAESRANRITHNLVANYMRRLDDGGGIYTTDALPGSEIAHNVVVHMRPPDPDTKAGGALYLDQFTSGVHVHDNVVRDAIRWLFIWNPNIRGNRVEANYADTPAWRNDGADNFVEPALSLDSPAAAAKAGALQAAAGIEPAFAAARNFTAATDLVLDTTSMTFQTLRGPWTAAEPAARHAPSILASPAPGAAARWLPALPRRGRYEVSVWWHAGSAAGNARITHAQGESIVPIAGESATGWIVLGQFPFEAGAGAQLELTRGPGPAPEPLRLDSVRFRLVSEPAAP